MPVTTTVIQVNMKQDTDNEVNEVLGKDAYNSLLSIGSILAKTNMTRVFFDFTNGKEMVRFY